MQKEERLSMFNSISQTQGVSLSRNGWKNWSPQTERISVMISGLLNSDGLLACRLWKK